MSLAVANNIMESGERERVSIQGNHLRAQGNLAGKEQSERMWNDLNNTSEGITGIREMSTLTTLGKGVYKAGGPGSFLAQEAGKTAAAASKTAGKVAAGAAAAGEAIQSTAKQVALGSTAAQTAARGSFTAAQTAAKTTATVTSDAAKMKDAGNIAGAADEGANTLFGAVKTFGKTSIPLIGAIPGAIDAVQDVVHGNFGGGSTADKWSNGLTIAGTVMDFIPGLEWVGALTGAVAGGMSLDENINKQKKETGDNAATDLNNHAPLPSVQSWSHMGLVSSLSSDASQHISGGGHF